MATLNTPKIVRRVRQRLELSQEGLSRMLNATKGAVQHWERGRNRPDLARLMALRQLCPPGAERKDLDAVIRETQAQVAPFSSGVAGPTAPGAAARARAARLVPPFADKSLLMLKRENGRLQRQANRLQGLLDRRNEQLRILQDLATELQREMAKLRAGEAEKAERPHGAAEAGAK